MIQETIRLLVILFTLICLTSLVHRVRYGATISDLIKTHFYEIIPLRSFFWTLFAGLIYGFLFFSLAVITNIYMIFNYYYYSFSKTSEHLLVNGVFAGILGILIWLFKSYLLEIPPHNPISIKTENIVIRYGIAPRLIKNLGAERFPNEISSTISRDQKIRWLFVIAGALCISLIIFILLKKEEYGLEINLNQPIKRLVLQYPTTWDIVFLCVTFIIMTFIILLLFNNLDYTFIPFINFLYFKFFLLIAVIDCLIWFDFSFHLTVFILAIIITAYGLRAIIDLTTESKYKKLKQIYNPISAKIRENTSYLDRFSKDPDLKLDSLQNDLLIQRINQGCKNIEKRGIFVTRNFGRFLKLIEVQHEKFAVAMLRYLTVRRYITRSNSSGTSRLLQHPNVPMWDLDLFPINPPRGYVNWTDPFWLPSKWDIIETCGNCGGSGCVSTTNSDHEGNGTTITTTCGACGGSGRLEYTQILNTQWQRLLPLVTYPEIPTPELVEDAEEQVIYRLPLTERFSSCSESAQIMRTNSPLIRRMHETGEQLEYLHKFFQSEIEKLHSGYLYRADFQIASFRTIMIKFANLGGSVGWFFGRRPELYFPQLPLSWITVFTFALLPPLWIAFFVFLLEISVNIFPFLVK